MRMTYLYSSMIGLLFFFLSLCPKSYSLKCETSSYPPNSSEILEEYVINLDYAPENRWKELITKKAHFINNMFDDIEDLMKSLVGEKLYNILESSLPKIGETLPYPYKQELQGMANYSNLTMAHLTMYNIFYELFVLCTSIVAEDHEGNIIHARNLDNGALLGWDTKNHTWKITEKLKPLTVVLHWKKGGKIIYKSVNFAGYVGLLTAVKKNKFSFSLNKRMALNNGIIGLLEWLLFQDHNQKWVAFLPREVFETAETYNEAKTMLSTTRLLAPVYYILSGTQSGEGVLITRYRDSATLLELNGKKTGETHWFLVETNYDNWKKPPFYDDRRTPTIECLTAEGRGNASLSLLYNVLSTKPVLNKSTVYTTLMQAKTGLMSTWLRRCPDPCYPW